MDFRYSWLSDGSWLQQYTPYAFRHCLNVITLWKFRHKIITLIPQTTLSLNRDYLYRKYFNQRLFPFAYFSRKHSCYQFDTWLHFQESELVKLLSSFWFSKEKLSLRDFIIFLRYWDTFVVQSPFSNHFHDRENGALSFIRTQHVNKEPEYDGGFNSPLGSVRDDLDPFKRFLQDGERHRSNSQVAAASLVSKPNLLKPYS